MSTRLSLFLLAGLTGCSMQLRGEVPAPRVVVVVGTEVRYCESCDDDVFFWSNAWWAYRSDGWYARRTWSEPWVVVEIGRLPVVFMDVPPDRFRHRYGPRHPGHEHHPDRDRWTTVAPPVAHGDGDHREGGVVVEPGSGRGRGNERSDGDGRPDAVTRDHEPERGREPQVTDDKGHNDKDDGKVKGDKDKDKDKDKEDGKDKSKEKSKDKEKHRGKSRGKSSRSGPDSR